MKGYSILCDCWFLMGRMDDGRMGQWTEKGELRGKREEGRGRKGQGKMEHMIRDRQRAARSQHPHPFPFKSKNGKGRKQF